MMFKGLFSTAPHNVMHSRDWTCRW